MFVDGELCYGGRPGGHAESDAYRLGTVGLQAFEDLMAATLTRQECASRSGAVSAPDLPLSATPATTAAAEADTDAAHIPVEAPPAPMAVTAALAAALPLGVTLAAAAPRVQAAPALSAVVMPHSEATAGLAETSLVVAHAAGCPSAQAVAVAVPATASETDRVLPQLCEWQNLQQPQEGKASIQNLQHCHQLVQLVSQALHTEGASGGAIHWWTH